MSPIRPRLELHHQIHTGGAHRWVPIAATPTTARTGAAQLQTAPARITPAAAAARIVVPSPIPAVYRGQV